MLRYSIAPQIRRARCFGRNHSASPASERHRPLGHYRASQSVRRKFLCGGGLRFSTPCIRRLFDSAFINQLYLNLGALRIFGSEVLGEPPQCFWRPKLPSQVARAEVAAEIAFMLQTFDPNATGDAKIRARHLSKTRLPYPKPSLTPETQSSIRRRRACPTPLISAQRTS